MTLSLGADWIKTLGPLTYNCKNGVSTFPKSFLSDLCQTYRYPEQAQNLGQVRILIVSDCSHRSQAPLSTKINYHRLIIGRWGRNASTFIIDWIVVKLAGDHDMHNILDEFEFRLDLTCHVGVTCPWAPKIPMYLHFQTWIYLRPVGQSWSNFICSINGVVEMIH